MDGILLAFGPDIKKRSTVEASSILDIAPTILNYLGLQVPSYMEGKVLELFDRTRPPSHKSKLTGLDGELLNLVKKLEKESKI